MMTISVCETKDGTALDQYEKEIEVSKLDKSNCVNIYATDDNGDTYLIQIPTKDFSEFVRMCQRMKATLS